MSPIASTGCGIAMAIAALPLTFLLQRLALLLLKRFGIDWDELLPLTIRMLLAGMVVGKVASWLLGPMFPYFKLGTELFRDSLITIAIFLTAILISEGLGKIQAYACRAAVASVDRRARPAWRWGRSCRWGWPICFGTIVPRRTKHSLAGLDAARRLGRRGDQRLDRRFQYPGADHADAGKQCRQPAPAAERHGQSGHGAGLPAGLGRDAAVVRHGAEAGATAVARPWRRRPRSRSPTPAKRRVARAGRNW